jgi:hypothetical protein
MSLVSPARVEALRILCRVEEDQAFAAETDLRDFLANKGIYIM